MRHLAFRRFTDQEHDTWARLFSAQARKRDAQIHPIFQAGIERLGIDNRGRGPGGVPDLDAVNRRLSERTGFRGVPVEGLEKDESFYAMLARGEFPIGNFIRDPRDLSYTPAPDVFHDLYGHLPFLADEAYAAFCRDLGRRAEALRSVPGALEQFARLFWFAVEFALVETPKGRRIFGAGIASSIGECEYALSAAPEVVPFDLDRIRRQEFRIDDFQGRLFLLESPEQLYRCLPEYEAMVRRDPLTATVAPKERL